MTNYEDLPLVDVTAAHLIEGTLVSLDFSDGFSRIVDLSLLMVGPVWEDIRKSDSFSLFEVDEDLGTLVWPNGTDLAPEVLRYEERISA